MKCYVPFYPWLPSVLMDIAIVPCVETSVRLYICLSVHPSWTKLQLLSLEGFQISAWNFEGLMHSTMTLLVFKNSRCQPEIWWTNAYYHEADQYIKWLCWANFYAFHGTLLHFTIVSRQRVFSSEYLVYCWLYSSLKLALAIVSR